LNKVLLPGLVLYMVLSGLGIFHGPGLSSNFLVPWLAGYLVLVFLVSYRFLFQKQKASSTGITPVILGIIGLHFLIQVTGGESSPLRFGYVLLVAAATFQPAFHAYLAPALITGIEAMNHLLHGNGPAAGWLSPAALGISLLGTVAIIAPFASRIRNQARIDRERYQKLLSDARALDPLAGGAKIDAITDSGRQAANVSVAMEREGAFQGLFDVIAGIVPAHTYALFVDDQGSGVFTLRAMRSRSPFAASTALQIPRGSGLIGICANTNQPQYLPHMVIPVKSLGYYTQDAPVKSFLALPVRQGERIAGVLAVDSLESEAFPPDTQDLFMRFVPFFSQIIDKIRMTREMDLRANNFAALHKMSEVLNSSLELGEILEKLMDQLRSIADYDVCAFTLYEEKNEEIVLTSLRGYDPAFTGRRFPLDQSAIIRLLLSQWRDRTAVTAYYAARLGSRGKEIGLFPFRELQKPLNSLYGRPLVAREKFIGAFFLGSRRADAFTEYQRYLLDTLMNQVSMVIDNSVLHRSIRDMALTDGLTGLLNHRTFMEKVQEEFSRLDREPKPFSLLLMDIDKFKAVNDTHGHPVGDVAIKAIAGIIRKSARTIDYVARYGGEEFAVGMVGAGSDGAFRMAQRIRKAVESTPIAVGRVVLKCTLSIGVATLRLGRETKEDLLKRADEALYQAKGSGRNRVCLSEQ
jgi:diguanylate cyclase (GGDEF)-like protein